MTIDHAAALFTVDIVAAARTNDQFRRVLSTGPHALVVVMSIPPGGACRAACHPRVVPVSGSGPASS